MNFYFFAFTFFFRTLVFSILLFAFFTSCKSPSDQSKQSPDKLNTSSYLNHSDSARYVGINTCRQCHQDIYNTFIKTGMGKSFDIASKTKSSASFEKSSIYDRFSDFHYKAFWKDDSLFINEFRIQNSDTVFSRIEQVNYIVGSGQHTNSHIQSVNGYLYQMPMTFYTQKKHWDLPPGFENGVNTRFSRKIGLECMSCHNAYPDFVKGSENKFKHVPGGIDCERCHGPGSVHVEQKQTGNLVDTSKYIDYSIVNPAKLPVNLQFDICQRCHLQGNAVLKDGKSFFDFKPGLKLSDYMSVFLPRYKNADEDFIMASHADRLKQSACFIKTQEKLDANVSTALKPSKNALTCTTCHNPHVSVRETNPNVFNDACLRCHGGATEHKKSLATIHSHVGLKTFSNCVSCHMPLSGASDIPHVSVHDHYIRKPISKSEKQKIKTFVGLYAINDKTPDNLTLAKAYIDQYDKFDQNADYLDSAEIILSKQNDLRKTFHLLIQLYFIKQDVKSILKIVKDLNEEVCHNELIISKSYDNRDAWSAYRISEANVAVGENESALKWINKAVELAPFNLEFRNKLASAYAAMNQIDKAAKQYEFILQENPKYVAAYSNLGYIRLLQNFPAEALRLYLIGKNLDSDNEALLLNLSAYYLKLNDVKNAVKYLERIAVINPQNQQVKSILKKLKP